MSLILRALVPAAVVVLSCSLGGWSQARAQSHFHSQSEAAALAVAAEKAISALRLPLEEYLSRVRAESPGIQAAKAGAASAEAQASGIRLPPPMVGLMRMREGSATRNGLEISQEIPFPSKFGDERLARQRVAEATKGQSRYLEEIILAEARAAYMAFWAAHGKAEIAREKRDWLKGHVRLARASTRSEVEAALHLLGMEGEFELAESEVLALEAERAEKLAFLGTFLPPLANEGEIVPIEPPLDLARDGFRGAEDGILQPYLDWRSKEVEATAAAQSLAQQAYVPDLFLRYRGYEAGEMAARSDELMLGISVPFLYLWQPRAESRAASAKLTAARAEFERAKADSAAVLRAAMKKAEAVKTQLELLNEKIIPRAEKRLKLIMNLSRRTVEGLDEHRMAMIALLELRAKRIDLRVAYEQALRELRTVGQQGGQNAMATSNTTEAARTGM